MPLTSQRRDLLKALVRSGELWEAVQDVFQEEAISALDRQDDAAMAESPQLSSLIRLTAERITWLKAAQAIASAAIKPEEPSQ